MNSETTRQALALSRDWLEFASPFAGTLFLKALLWGLLFAGLGLLVAIVVTGLIHKRRLLRREHRVWNWGAKLSYLLVLSACVLLGLIGGGLFGIQRTVNQAVQETLQPALVQRMPALREQMVTRLGPMASDGVLTARDLVQPIVQDFLYQPRSASGIERWKADLINRFVMEFGAVALKHALQKALEALPEVLPAASNGTQNELVSFSIGAVAKVLAGTGEKLDFSPLDRSVPEIFGNALHKQIDGFFKGLYTGLLIKLLLVAALIGLEMLIYFRYWLPRKRKADMPEEPLPA